MTSPFLTIGAVACALMLFQTATLVIGGHVAKDFLRVFYESFPLWWQRMLIVIIPLSGIGNLFATYAFQNPVVAGVSFLVLGLWSPIIVALIINGSRLAPTEIGILIAITLLALWLGSRLS
jgi:hypothetical protein